MHCKFPVSEIDSAVQYELVCVRACVCVCGFLCRMHYLRSEVKALKLLAVPVNRRDHTVPT